jgi:hypothetical protein
MMKKYIALGAMTALCGGCALEQPAPTEVELRAPLFVAGGNTGFNLGTHLTGDEEVPPRDTRAQGQAIFRVSGDEKSVGYKLIAANISNVFQAHIHLGAVGANGPIVVWLYPSTAPVAGPLGQGRINGVIAQGTFTSANLVGPMAGRSVLDLLAAIRSGGTYVNVHTNDGVTPSNTGPGDFPGGEIRGQINHASSHANR